MDKKKIIILSTFLVICFFVAYFVHRKPLWDRGSWQAVFLNNNQVYFGKIKKLDKENLILEDIYYLQTGETLQENKDGNSTVNLVRLGSELHGPTSRMVINKVNVLFWEDLKNDAKIVKIINQLN